MALDGPKEGDEIFNEEGIMFLINKELFDEVSPVGIDFVVTDTGGGFKITSKLTEKNTCGSCSC
jgi:Fe-S cluster assembly iron-binding protein IscA